MMRPNWDFEYRPLSQPLAGADREERDFVVATHRETSFERLANCCEAVGSSVRVEVLLCRPPLFWYRVSLEAACTRQELHTALADSGVVVRYVTSSSRGSLSLGKSADFSEVRPSSCEDWAIRPTRAHAEEATPGRWFLDENTGVDVDRGICGTGSGARLAVIDDQARDLELLDLDDDRVLGGPPQKAAVHGALMIALAVGSKGDPVRGIPPFVGVAPDASTRFYCIPTPDRAVLWLPLAIIRAVDDGADVIVCSTYVDELMSPLLDDALEFAVRAGRGGLGTAVVLPAGREISSPAGTSRPSLTLSLTCPASDPRVLCVAPSGKDGGWFLWTDKHGKKKPFANRGPAVRVASPGDDVAYPFFRVERMGHAESSGAAAIAGGVASLVVATNPGLRLEELLQLLETTARPCSATQDPLANVSDQLPAFRDADGHDAKCGYGRLSARRACLSAADPFTAALCAIGDHQVATGLLLYLRARPEPDRLYSPTLAAWAARAFRKDDVFRHAILMLVRHLRLLAGHPDRQTAQMPGATARLLAIVTRRLVSGFVPPEVAAHVSPEIRALAEGISSLADSARLESELFELATELFAHSGTQALTA